MIILAWIGSITIVLFLLVILGAWFESWVWSIVDENTSILERKVDELFVRLQNLEKEVKK